MYAKENAPATRGHRRRRTLANITNLSLSSGWASESLGLLKSSGGKSSGDDDVQQLKVLLAEKEATIELQAAQLDQTQKEFFVQLRRHTQVNEELKGMLGEKEAAIRLHTTELDQMQKEFYNQLRRHSQVNEELILHNSRLGRDNGQLREQLKLLQHEYCQMTVAYRVSQSELQVKLEESNEMVTKLLIQNASLGSSPINDEPSSLHATKVPTRPRSRSAQRRHSAGNALPEDDWNGSRKVLGGESSKRTCFSRKSSATVPKEQQQQPDARSRYPASTPVPNPTPTATQTYQKQQQEHAVNLYGLIGMEPMAEVSSEDESPRERTWTRSDLHDRRIEVGSNSNPGSGLESELSRGSNSSSSSTGSSSIRNSGRRPFCLNPENSAAAAAAAGVPASSARLTTVPPTASAKRAQPLPSSSTSAVSQKPFPVTAAADSNHALHFSRRTPSSTGSTHAHLAVTGSGRPVRRAVEKVVSYTEPQLKTKMRRP